MSEITLKLIEARALYERHFQRALPDDLPFSEAAQEVFAEVGREEFMLRLNELREQYPNPIDIPHTLKVH